jgi:hypothetical protein
VVVKTEEAGRGGVGEEEREERLRLSESHLTAPAALGRLRLWVLVCVAMKSGVQHTATSKACAFATQLPDGGYCLAVHARGSSGREAAVLSSMSRPATRSPSLPSLPLTAMAVQFRQPDGSESPLLPPGLSLLISDTLESPATFLLVQHLALALKARRPCVLVGLAQSFEYYTAVLRKQVRLPVSRMTAAMLGPSLSGPLSVPAGRSTSD